MEYFFELAAWRRSEVDSIIEEGRGVVSKYTIPEGPGGYPGLFSLATAVYIKHSHGAGSIPHVRLYDINRLALLSIANAVAEYELDGLVLLRGDKPVEGGIVEDIGTEEAISLLKKKGYRFPIGVILSLNFPPEEIKRRIELGADFYYVINYAPWKNEVLKDIAREAWSRNLKVYVFLLLGIGRNRKLFMKLGQPYIEGDRLGDALRSLNNIVDGVILSSPFEPIEGLRLLARHAI